MGYVVTAPYITVRVKDDVGSDVIRGFYRGATLPDEVNDDDLDKQVRKGLVAEAGSDEAALATPFGDPVSFDDDGNPLTPQQAADREREREQRRAARQQTRTGDKTEARKADTGRQAGRQAEAKG